MPRIHPRTIDAVKERADIVDVVGEHIVLKKKGKEFVGICPFHDDSKPSMTVSPLKQFYYCFSCGAGGNSIKFLMEFQRQSFSDVVLGLARKYQLPVETVEGPQQERFRQQFSRREKLYRVLNLAKEWFRRQLNEKKGINALEYLKSSRNLSDSTIISFELGYAPDNWDSLFNYLHDIENVSIEFIEATGLVIARKRGDGFYDRFRNRLIVPIKDRQGRVIGFGGRSMDGSEPKYLNSPETEIFEKGLHLYGLDKASSEIHKSDKAIVVEGYFDVIALHQAGICNTVASLGTALSGKQITQLCRCSDSKRIILNFDSDTAGIKAANRAITEVEHLSMHGQLELRILQLPTGKDPDEYLKDHSSEDYRALIENSPLWLDWQLDQTVRNLDLAKSDDFQTAVTGFVQLLGKLPQSAIRSHYLQKVAERLSGGHSRLALQLEEDLRKQVNGQRWHGRSSRHQQPGEASLRQRSEADILRLYIHSSEHRSTIRQELRLRELDDFAIYQHRLIWAGINELEEKIIGIKLLEEINRGQDPGEELSEIDLTRLLLDEGIADNKELSTYLSTLLEPGEVQIAILSQPLLHFKGAVAVLERQKSLRRCKHLIESWGAQRLQTLEQCISFLIEKDHEKSTENYDMESMIVEMFDDLNRDAINFQELYYSERKHILLLDKQRCLNEQSDKIISA